MKKYIIAVLAAILPAIFFATPAFACTGVYVGCDANDQGTSLVARSSDSGFLNHPVHVKVYGGADGEKLTKIVCDGGFTYEFPSNMLRFITTPSNESIDRCGFYATAINECGVSITATVTGYSSNDSLKFNSFVEDGLGEDIMDLIVGAQAHSAREGIEILAKIIDEHGSCEDNIIMISDQKECWYMEIIGGHQYCAVKAPNDCVACIGNEFAITTEYATCEDAICSPDLFELPKRNNFAVYNSDGKMNIFNTYVGENHHTDFSHLRTWGGHHYMAPSTAGTYSTNMYLPLFYKPDRKITLSDVAEIFRYRYEDTEFCPETNGRDDIRVIATEEQTKTHILQTYKNLPANKAVVNWFCPNSAEFGTFVPISNAEKVFDNSYTVNPFEHSLTEDSCATVMKELNTICAQNRKKLSKTVRDYWKSTEHYSQTMMPQILESGNIDEFCSGMQKWAYEDCKRLKSDVEWYLMGDTITWRKNVNLNTQEYSEKYYPDFVSSVDVALFAKLTGWNILENTIRSRNNGTPDPSIAGHKTQAEVGGSEGYIKIQKGDKTIELITSNGHDRSVGKIIENGQEKENIVYLDNNKVFTTIPFLNILTNGDYMKFTDFNTFDMSSYNPPINLFVGIAGFPIWGQILLIVGAIIVLVGVGILIGRKVKK
ncbi:MAG: C69 family dipeptidase [Coriobacteriia bacterium]|nr:C69 family dipeptidase [Coriobacteriia bacterium]